MPTPDLPGYIDLTVLDRGPLDYVERARVNMEVSIAGFDWRVGTPEAVLIESLALIAAEMGYQINRIPAAVFETLMGLLGVAYDQGAAPVATITITFADAVGYQLPAGSRFRLDLDSGPVVFTLDADAVVAPGGTQAIGRAVTATTFTAEANGVAIGTPLAFMGSFSAFQSAVLASLPAGGAGPETTAAWFDRGAARLASLSEVLTTPTQFENAAVSLEPAVARIKAFDRFDPGSGNAAALKLDLGHITLAVSDAAGAPLTAPQKTALETALEDLARVELDVHLIDPTITLVEVDVTVVRLAGFAAADVQAAVLAALDAYLDPASWPWGATVYRNELISVVDQVEGVDRVDTLTNPAADAALAGTAPLANLNVATSSVTVLDPA